MRYLFILLLVSSLTCWGQQEAFQFEKQWKESFATKPKLDIKFDSRHSFITNTSARFWGIKAGANFNETFAIGLGFNYLYSKVLFSYGGITVNSFTGTDVDLRLKYYYFSPYIEYFFYRNKKWQMSIPVQIGIGKSYYLNVANNKKERQFSSFMLSYEPAITVDYKIIPYIGIGAGVVYRLMMASSSVTSLQFNAPMYIFKLKIYFKQIGEDIGVIKNDE